MADMLSRKRHARIAFPRMVAMYLTREMLPDLSLEEIGEKFARHYTSIIHGHTVISGLIDVYKQVEESIDYLENKLASIPTEEIPSAFMPYGNCQ